MTDEELIADCINTVVDMVEYAQEGHLRAILFIFSADMKNLCKGIGLSYTDVIRMALEDE